MGHKNDCLITVLITNYNTADFVQVSLCALQSLTRNPYKVIINDMEGEFPVIVHNVITGKKKEEKIIAKKKNTIKKKKIVYRAISHTKTVQEDKEKIETKIKEVDHDMDKLS